MSTRKGGTREATPYSRGRDGDDTRHDSRTSQRACAAEARRVAVALPVVEVTGRFWLPGDRHIVAERRRLGSVQQVVKR